MNTATIANNNCRQYVQQRKPFKNHNNTLFGLWVRDDMYVVFSYGMHWPLFAWESDGFGSGAWYANSDKYSVTTSKHYSQAHPWSDPAPLPMNQKEMLRLIEHGIAGVAAGAPSSHEEYFEHSRRHAYTT